MTDHKDDRLTSLPKLGSLEPGSTYTFAPSGKYDVTARARDLSPGEMTSLEKVASYRALVGKQAGRIRQLEAVLRDLRDQTAPASSAAQMIERALAEWPEQ